MNRSKKMTATYTKLKSGDWGVRIEGGTVKQGDTITVTKKSGERKQETIAKVVWTGNGITLAAIGQSQPSRTHDNRTERESSGQYCGYPCPVTGRKCCSANGPCHDCQ
jgi:hypothetical protein